MAVILNFSVFEQAHIERDDAYDDSGWWVNPKIWADRTHVECIERPVEARALLNLYLEARALRHYNRYRTILTPVERKAKALELEALRTPHIRGEALFGYVASRLTTAGDKWTWRRARGILEDITDVLRNAELAALLDLQAKAEKRKSDYFRSVVQDVLREGVGADEVAEAA